MEKRQIVAVGLLTEHKLQLLGKGFSRAWPINNAPDFDELLNAIDHAEREMWRARNQQGSPTP